MSNSDQCPECTDSTTVFAYVAGSLCVFMIILGICRIARSCMLSDGYRSQDVNGSENSPTRLKSEGLASVVIIALPEIQFKKRARGDNENPNSECCICLGAFTEGEWLRLLPYCVHAFHVSCIDTWLRANSNCPMCRSNVLNAIGDLQPSVLATNSLETHPREEP